MKYRLLFISLLMMAAGCSRQDFTTAMSSPRSGVIGQRNTNGLSQTSAEMRAERMAHILTQWKQQSESATDDYRLQPGDEVDVGIFALDTPDTTTHLKRTIAKDKTIELPWVGTVVAADLTARELVTAITKLYVKKFIKNPQVTVDVGEFKGSAVLLTGAIVRPGIYYLNKNKSTILEVLAMAGGLTAQASDELMIIRGASTNWVSSSSNELPKTKSEALLKAASDSSKQVTIPIDLRQLIDDADLRLNAEVMSGDIINVRSLAQQYIYVLGYVQRPGAYELKSNLEAMRAVAIAGGLSASARAENCTVIREREGGQQVIRLNLIKVAQGKKMPFYLEAGDTLVVGTSFFARLGEFVRPSVGAGMSYSPLP